VTVQDDRGPALTVQLDESGFVRLTWAAEVLITSELARAAMNLVDEANAGRQRPLLVDITGTPSMSREARIVFSRRYSASKIAVLGRSPGASGHYELHGRGVLRSGADPVLRLGGLRGGVVVRVIGAVLLR
jgi:hypothetical protein